MRTALHRVIFTCGGTAGHVNPAIALAQLTRERDPQAEILFVGADRGLEKDLVPKAGYHFQTVHISNFHRSLAPKEIGHNLISLYNMSLRSPREARTILDEFRPEVVIGTGGYAGYPMIRSAARAGVPTVIHESNVVPGLTTKMLEPCASRILVGFEACREHYRSEEKVIVTGTPVRGDFFALTRREARQRLGIRDEKPLVVSFWGSLGASGMNRNMAGCLALEAARESFHHIHGAGKSGYAAVLEQLKEKNIRLEEHPAIELREYIYDMAVVMRAADLVVCRAGASTISELTALGVPALIVPSPYVANNHQEKNAQALEAAGAAVVLRESEAIGQTLYRKICAILRDERQRESMGERMRSLGFRDAAERIYEAVLEIIQ